MAEGHVQRRLAAIAIADVVGYSRLMGADETGTLAALKQRRSVILNPTVRNHGGRVVKVMGDGVLVEFASAVNAVTAAIELQNKMAQANEPLPENRRIVLRIGINLGDVIGEGSDIYGEGVNIAARLEALAEPGGICIASIVNESVGNRIDAAFKDGGEVQVKNIERPVRIWRWHPSNSGEVVPASPVSPTATHDALPSLAALPFQNMSGDAEQDYFADGVVEDLITALSRFRSFAVIARNSSFVYKGRSVDVRQVARELGVRYVLEGSVRRSGDRLRIAAQLIDGTSGSHLWARNFDGIVADIFDVQDRITESVVAVVEPRIQRAEIERSRRERPESLDAYDLYLQGLQKLNAMQPEENASAFELFDRAIAVEPGYATALAAAAHGLEHRITMGWPPLSTDDEQKSVRLAHAALAVGVDDAMVLARCGMVLLQLRGEYDQAIRRFNRAVDVNPNNVGVLTLAGLGNLIAGSLDDAMTIFQRVIRLSPGDTYEAMTGIAHVHLRLRDFEQALDWAGRSIAENPNYNPTYWALIAANAHLGRLAEARRALAALQVLVPGVSLANFSRRRHADARHKIMVEGMRLAGMPEV